MISDKVLPKLTLSGNVDYEEEEYIEEAVEDDRLETVCDINKTVMLDEYISSDHE